MTNEPTVQPSEAKRLKAARANVHRLFKFPDNEAWLEIHELVVAELEAAVRAPLERELETLREALEAAGDTASGEVLTGMRFLDRLGTRTPARIEPHSAWRCAIVFAIADLALAFGLAEPPDD